jgi:hypothetical protein
MLAENMIQGQCCGSGSETRDPESGAFLTPRSGIRDGKKSDPDPGSGMNIPVFRELRNSFFGYTVPEQNSLMRIRIWDPESF